MEIVYDAEKLRTLYNAKYSKFRHLKDYLYICGFICGVLPIKDAVDLVDPFPPKKEIYNIFYEEIHKLSSNRNKSTKLLEFDEKKFEDELRYVIHGFVIDGHNILKSIKLDDYESFTVLGNYCVVVSWLYDGIKSYDLLLKHIDTIKRIDDLGFQTIAKASELLGYWTARMEIRKQKRKNVLSGSKVSENKKKLKELYEKYDKKNCFALRIEAQQAINRSERTVLNILNEIKAEEKE